MKHRERQRPECPGHTQGGYVMGWVPQAWVLTGVGVDKGYQVP